MSYLGFDVEGCRGVRVVGYTLAGGSRTEITDCVLEALYDDDVTITVSTPVEMNLASFLAAIEALNRRCQQPRPRPAK